MLSLKRRILLGAFCAADLSGMAVAFAVATVTTARIFSPGNVEEFLTVHIKLANLLFLIVFALL